MANYSAQTLKELISLRSRELSSRSREVYKDKKIKRYNDTSRMSGEDDLGIEVSYETCPWPEAVASNPLAIDFVSVAPKGAAGESGSVYPPRELSSRSGETYSGITIQHARTARGVKLFVSLQTPQQAEQSEYTAVTAELKRYDRMREIQARESDSDYFVDYLENLKQQLQESARSDTDIKNTVAIGRLHLRGRRASWCADSVMVARMRDNAIESVMLHIEGEEYVIELGQETSRLQQQHYHSVGHWGNLVRKSERVRIKDLPTRSI